MGIRKKYEKYAVPVRAFWRKYDVSFWLSVAGPFGMGLIHFIVSAISFSWMYFNYFLFCLVVLLCRIFIKFLSLFGLSRAYYIAGAFFLLVSMVPLAVSMVLTIMLRDAPVYVFQWLVYVYALYATVKISKAIVDRHRARKRREDYRGVLSLVSIVSALYTVQMMEFVLVETFSSSAEHTALVALQFISQGAILVFAASCAVYLAVSFFRYPARKRAADSADKTGEPALNTNK